jgi:hypothetical protein
MQDRETTQLHKPMNSMKNQRGREESGSPKMKNAGMGKSRNSRKGQQDDGLSKQTATEAPDRFPENEI